MTPQTPQLPSDPVAALRAIEDVATDWMVRCDRGLIPEEDLAFGEWMAADPRNEAAFTALEATWHLMGESRLAAEAADGEERTGLPSRLWRRWWLPAGLAAAAAVTVSAVFGWRSWRAHTGPYDLVAATEVGAVRHINLPDGSAVELNTDSRIEVHFTAAERRVRLAQGEAHFAVAKNPARLFIVGVAGLEVRAVGTAFDVYLRSESVEVLVTEGRVHLQEAKPMANLVSGPAFPRNFSAVAPLGTLHDLSAGQKATIAFVAAPARSPNPPVVACVPPAAIEQALSWQERRLDFDSMPLGEVVDQINRYSNHKLVIMDPRLKAKRFGGSFPVTDYETFVRMLEANFGIVGENRGDKTLLRLGKP